MKEYKTIKDPIKSEIIIKKSRFIAHLFYVSSAQEAANLIESVSKEHFKATHNTYAYRIGGETDELVKFSDDGEPSGTAGRPILSVLTGNELYNVLIIVTRYFGGVKLGANGLVRAYTQSAATAVAESSILVNIPCKKTTLTYDYTYHNRIMSMVSSMEEIVLGEQTFDSAVKSEFIIKENSYDRFISMVTELTLGSFSYTKPKDIYLERKLSSIVK